MPSLLRTAAGLSLALLISSHSVVLAETSSAERCGWVRPPLTARPKSPSPKFSLNVVLRAFSLKKTPAAPPANPAHTDIQPPTDLALYNNRIEAELRSQASALPTLTDRKPLPNFLSWMRGWRFEKDRGLFRPIRSRSRLALSYSDIFETRGNPDKGGHGLGLLFRHDFAANRRLN